MQGKFNDRLSQKVMKDPIVKVDNFTLATLGDFICQHGGIFIC